MAFFFPHIHAEIDWDQGYEFLDTELQQIVRDADLGKRLADKLVKVTVRDGSEAWVLIHIEIQGQQEGVFGQRMYIYHARIFDRYNHEVVSLALLGDERETWRPDSYTHERWGCSLRFTFPMIKLLDYRQQWAVLEANRNPFATVVMAHLKTQETRRNPLERKHWKFAIARRLYEQAYTRQEILQLLHFLDWIMRLPRELEEQFLQEIEQYEEAQRMPYVNSFERFALERGIAQGLEQGLQEGIEKGLQEGIEKGLQEGIKQGLQEGLHEGLLEGLALALDLKFGEASTPLLEEIRQIEDVALLRKIHQAIRTAATPDDLRKQYRPMSG
jgi:flagellar biosynthesis/type III secretory pathway protein FliH